MKKTFLILLFFTVLSLSKNTLLAQEMSQQELKVKIENLDSLFFQAYNNCDIATQRSLYNDTIEFYHDKSGLETSKEKILADTRKYICGKVNRILVRGSIEVSPIPGYGAIELGAHQFHSLEENSLSEPSKFVIFWKYKNNKWTISKVISLH